MPLCIIRTPSIPSFISINNSLIPASFCAALAATLLPLIYVGLLHFEVAAIAAINHPKSIFLVNPCWHFACRHHSCAPRFTSLLSVDVTWRRLHRFLFRLLLLALYLPYQIAVDLSTTDLLLFVLLLQPRFQLPLTQQPSGPLLARSLPCFGFTPGEDVYHPMTHPTFLICQWIYRQYGCSNHVILLSARFAIQLARFANQLECYFYATLLPWR